MDEGAGANPVHIHEADRVIARIADIGIADAVEIEAQHHLIFDAAQIMAQIGADPAPGLFLDMI